MKKMFIIMVALVLSTGLLIGCSVQEKPADSTTASTPSTTVTTDYIIWETPASQGEATTSNDSGDRFVNNGNGQFQVLPSDAIKVDTTKLNIAGNYNVLNSMAMANGAKLSGLESEFTTFWSDEIALKIMAGDSDVDIYLIDSSTLNLFKERGIYYPIESDIISQFNSGCFDYLTEIATDSNGETVAMPIYSYTSFIAYPKQAADELGFDDDDIAYYNDFHELVNSYSGERRSYSRGDSFAAFYQHQYEKYYCNFADKKYDYSTELYRDIYSLYDGWFRYGPTPVMTGFTYPSALGSDSTRLILDSKKTLFTNDTSYCDLMLASNPDPFAPDTGYAPSDWRAVHIPWISEEVDKNFVNAIYAFINPYSKHYDESVKFLEYIADNYFDSVSSYTFIREDKEEYPDSYMPQTQIFNDVYEINANGFVLEHLLYSSRNDIEEFQNGRATLDEAIAMYQREIQMWLNE